MTYTFTCKKVPLSDSVKEYAQKRIDKLGRYFQEEPSVHVSFSVEREVLCAVEITIRSGSTILRSQSQAVDGDMRGAIDSGVAYIERQILKNKTRLAKRLRSEGFPPVVEDAPFTVNEEAEFDIVRTKHVSVKPMSAEEAILQMNLIGHSFYIFRNASDDAVSIVYRRNNGGYGLILADDME